MAKRPFAQILLAIGLVAGSLGWCPVFAEPPEGKGAATVKAAPGKAPAAKSVSASEPKVTQTLSDARKPEVGSLTGPSAMLQVAGTPEDRNDLKADVAALLRKIQVLTYLGIVLALLVVAGIVLSSLTLLSRKVQPAPVDPVRRDIPAGGVGTLGALENILGKTIRTEIRGLENLVERCSKAIDDLQEKVRLLQREVSAPRRDPVPIIPVVPETPATLRHEFPVEPRSAITRLEHAPAVESPRRAPMDLESMLIENHASLEWPQFLDFLKGERAILSWGFARIEEKGINPERHKWAITSGEEPCVLVWAPEAPERAYLLAQKTEYGKQDPGPPYGADILVVQRFASLAQFSSMDVVGSTMFELRKKGVVAIPKP